MFRCNSVITMSVLIGSMCAAGLSGCSRDDEPISVNVNIATDKAPAEFWRVHTAVVDKAVSFAEIGAVYTGADEFQSLRDMIDKHATVREDVVSGINERSHDQNGDLCLMLLTLANEGKTYPELTPFLDHMLNGQNHLIPAMRLAKYYKIPNLKPRLQEFIYAGTDESHYVVGQAIQTHLEQFGSSGIAESLEHFLTAGAVPPTFQLHLINSILRNADTEWTQRALETFALRLADEGMLEKDAAASIFNTLVQHNIVGGEAIDHQAKRYTKSHNKRLAKQAQAYLDMVGENSGD